MIEHLICKALKEAIFQSLVKLWSAQVLTHCPVVILGAFNSVLNIGSYGPIWSYIICMVPNIVSTIRNYYGQKNRRGFKLWTNYFGATTKKKITLWSLNKN